MLVKLVATIVRLGSIGPKVLRRSMAWGRSSTGPTGTAVGNSAGATAATSGDTTISIVLVGIFSPDSGGQVREEEEDHEAGAN